MDLFKIPSSSSDSISDEDVVAFVGLVAEAASHHPKKTRVSVRRDREGAHEQLMKDYFVEDPTYNEEVFNHRFRMSKELFLKIVTDLEVRFEYFQQRYDGRFRLGFSPIVKATSTIQQLAYGNVADVYDELLAMSERTSRETLQIFCDGIIQLYENEYLRKPTSHDIQRLYHAHEAKHGFPGMIGSIDVTQLEWRNCPTMWQGHFTGHHGSLSIALEAIASQDLWIWHAFFGVAGSNNDLNILYQSPLFNDQIHGTSPKCRFDVNGIHFDLGYYLADGIYPPWSVFVKTLRYPVEEKKKKFVKAQEAAGRTLKGHLVSLKQDWEFFEYLYDQCIPTEYESSYTLASF